MDTIITLNYKIRQLIYEDTYYLTSITSRQCLEDTYILMLKKSKLLDRLKYKIIKYLILL